jgi:hypothetical protein
MRHVYEQPARKSSVFARRAQLAGLMLLGCVSLAAAADKMAELSDDFLEYLGSMEGGDENWTDFATTNVATEAGHGSAQPAAKITDSNTAGSASSSSTASSTTKAASSMTGKVDK